MQIKHTHNCDWKRSENGELLMGCRQWDVCANGWHCKWDKSAKHKSQYNWKYNTLGWTISVGRQLTLGLPSNSVCLVRAINICEENENKIGNWGVLYPTAYRNTPITSKAVQICLWFLRKPERTMALASAECFRIRFSSDIVQGVWDFDGGVKYKREGV